MKIFLLIFLLFIPNTHALAVTPTNLDFGTFARGETVTRQIMLANTLPEPIDLSLSGIHLKELTLAAKESRVIEVPLVAHDLPDGVYKDKLMIKEDYKTNLANAITLPVVYKIYGGEFSEVTIDYSEIEVRKSSKSKIWIILACLIIVLIAAALLVYKSRKY